MKKVININFQGRVIPIEETAYESLKQYIDSLRQYFANEEGRDEIINDIEGRIAELFSERLKKGATCITDDDVNVMIANMGRPEDFEAQDADTSSANYQQKEYASQATYATSATAGRGRFVRNADDKIIGGVCSGIANYLRIDPVIMRIIFVLLFGALFWVYILLWIIVPSQSVQSNITKRLYRNPDDKVLGGVCGGLGSYFNIDTWIPRLIFTLPLIIALISGTFDAFWWDWNDFGFVPRIVSGSLGWTLFLTYVILWIAVPVASTAAEKLEMKGERINLNSIRDTVKEDMESFKSKAEKWGAEVKQTAQQFGGKAKEFGQTAGTQAKTFASEAAPIARSAGSGLGHAIGVIFKAFFLFIAAMIAITLFCLFVALLFGGFAVFPLKNFVLEGAIQNLLAWSALFLFLGVPIVALITWLVRRIIGVRSKHHYLGYVFGSLWFIGLVSAILLGGLVARNFRTKSVVEQRVASILSPQNKMVVEVARNDVRYFDNDWFGMNDGEDWPIYGINQDSLMMNTVRVNVVKSRDSAYHVYNMKFGRGNTRTEAERVAEKIEFNIVQQDSILLLPKGFSISKNEKFRNQQVLVIIEVPVGKRIVLDRSIDQYDWFSINFNRRRGWNYDDNWDNTYRWESNVEYIMTPEGLERTDRLDPQELNNGRFKLRIRDGEMDIDAEGTFEDRIDEQNNDGYRYRRETDTVERRVEDTQKISVRISSKNYSEAEGYDESSASGSKSSTELSTPLAVFSRMFQ